MRYRYGIERSILTVVGRFDAKKQRLGHLPRLSGSEIACYLGDSDPVWRCLERRVHGLRVLQTEARPDRERAPAGGFAGGIERARTERLCGGGSAAGSARSQAAGDVSGGGDGNRHGEFRQAAAGAGLSPRLADVEAAGRGVAGEREGAHPIGRGAGDGGRGAGGDFGGGDRRRHAGFPDPEFSPGVVSERGGGAAVRAGPQDPEAGGGAARGERVHRPVALCQTRDSWPTGSVIPCATRRSRRGPSRTLARPSARRDTAASRSLHSRWRRAPRRSAPPRAASIATRCSRKGWRLWVCTG